MWRRVVATFGNPDCGRLGLGERRGTVEIPVLITELLGLRPQAVAAGGAHTAVVLHDGTILAWGLNDKGQLGHSPDEQYVYEPREVPLPEPVVAIAAGNYHTLCLSETGRIWAWGSNAHGQIGIGQGIDHTHDPRLVSSLKDIKFKSLAAGAEHSLAVSSNGELYSFGYGNSGRLGHGTPPALKLWGNTRDEYKPRLIRALETHNVQQVAAGHMHSACVTADGKAFIFGSGRFYQLGRVSDADADVPMEVPQLHAVSQIACGGQHSLAVVHGGRVAAWGANQNGCLGQGRKATEVHTPVAVPGLVAEQVSAGWKHSAAIGSGGILYTWGWGGSQGKAMYFILALGLPAYIGVCLAHFFKN